MRSNFFLFFFAVGFGAICLNFISKPPIFNRPTQAVVRKKINRYGFDNSLKYANDIKLYDFRTPIECYS